MIMQAKQDSENKVRNDLTVARKQLEGIGGQIQELEGRVARCVGPNGKASSDPSRVVDKTFLDSKVKSLEDKWGSEVKALKQDLRRTILAHNHNSDLMRHHRDALDEARQKIDTLMPPKAEQVDNQIQKVDRLVRAGQAKQRALDALTERLTALEQQVGELIQGGFSGMFPQQGPAAGRFIGHGQQPRADAVAAARMAKDAELPTEEATARGDAHNFNAEAPVFVPHGAAQTTQTRPVAEATTAAVAAALGEVVGDGVAADPSAYLRMVADSPVSAPPGMEGYAATLAAAATADNRVAVSQE